LPRHDHRTTKLQLQFGLYAWEYMAESHSYLKIWTAKISLLPFLDKKKGLLDSAAPKLVRACLVI